MRVRPDHPIAQRYRLAGILAELEGTWTSDSMRGHPSRNLDRADALLARGVRVVDADTLAAAIWKATCHAKYCVCEPSSADILAALDGAR